MNANEILDHLAQLQNDVVVNERELTRQMALVDRGITNGAFERQAMDLHRSAVKERDEFVNAIRHHRLEQAHNSETCPLCIRPTAPIDRRCPACNANPGEPCTAPTDTSRRPVGWLHASREI